MGKQLKQHKRPSPLDVIRRVRNEHNVRRVAVSTSCGKDSIATLALCAACFDEVQPYFMYLVPGLSFQENYLQYIERRFSVSIVRVPHWMLGDLFRGSSFRHPTAASTKVRKVRMKDMDGYIRKKTGLDWIASGERCCDSLERNAMIKQCLGISPTRKRFFPIGYWSNAMTFNYLKSQNIALPADYGAGINFSFGSLWHRELKPVQDKFPADFEKICKYFPLVPAQMKRHEYREQQEKEEREQQERKERQHQQGG